MFQIEEDYRMMVSKETTKMYAVWPMMYRKVFEYASQLQINLMHHFGNVDVTKLTEGKYHIDVKRTILYYIHAHLCTQHTHLHYSNIFTRLLFCHIA